MGMKDKKLGLVWDMGWAEDSETHSHYQTKDFLESYKDLKG